MILVLPPISIQGTVKMDLQQKKKIPSVSQFIYITCKRQFVASSSRQRHSDTELNSWLKKLNTRKHPEKEFEVACVADRISRSSAFVLAATL